MMTTVDEQPPTPRKLPQQERSQRMVKAIVDACAKLLETHGEKAFTLPLLETVSGVTKGSIYQYFPNLEAIVAALNDREFETYTREGLRQMASHQGSYTLRDELTFLIDQAVSWHLRMHSLHSLFHTRYKLHYDAGRRFDEVFDNWDVIARFMAPLVAKEPGEGTTADPVQQAFLLMETLNNLSLSTLSHYPEMINDPRFHRQLLDTCMALVASARESYREDIPQPKLAPSAINR